jgi:alginate O-acetyltransferase complex protein AlgI
MVFTELRFLCFFLLVLAVHWGLRGNRARKLWLLAASYAFYSAWDWRFSGLIALSTLVDFLVAPRIHAARAQLIRRLWLSVSVVTNLGLLAFFKYFDFFVDSAVEFIGLLGFEAHRPSLSVVLPVGISFYTFQTMSYSLDVYARKLTPTRNLADFGLFVAFFPQLVAGPIVRARVFLPMLKTARRFADVEVRACLFLFLVGFIKKACISDNVGALVDTFFAEPGAFNALGAWTATATYAVQLYCDFSGYSDMAIACAGLCGYRLPLNFDFPYIASSLRDFWRRWHISLSSWLRDYLYLPLGGDRRGPLRTCANVLCVSLLGGLWHGAGWNFVLWGGMHGMGLLFEQALPSLPGGRGRLAAQRILGTLLTLWFVSLSLILFRAESLGDVWIAGRAFLLFDGAGSQDFGTNALWLCAVLFGVHALASTRVVERWLERIPNKGFALIYGAAWAGVLPFVASATQPFIYFQF